MLYIWVSRIAFLSQSLFIHNIMNFLVPKKMLCLVSFLKQKRKWDINFTIHLVLQTMSLEIGWDCALLEGMLYCLMNYFQCMFFMFAWYLDWYLPAFRSVIRKYILRLFVICNFFWNIGKCIYAVQLMLDLYMIIIYD